MFATYTAILILSSLILGQILVFLGICFQTPFQEPILVALCHLNKGKNRPLIVRIVGILLFLFLVFWVYSSFVIFVSWRIFHAPMNWNDEVAINNLILQASLVGFSLFAWMVLYKLHPVIMEQHSERKLIKNEEMLRQERKLRMEDHRRVLQGYVAELRAKMKKLERDLKIRTNRAQDAGVTVLDLKIRFEDFRLKYDRLFDYNQTLQNQLQSLSHDVQKIESNGETVDFENVMETTTKCGECLLSPTHSSSSPRHRRPIYQC